MQLYCSMCTYIAPCMHSYTVCPPIRITLPPILALFLPSEKWWLYNYINMCSHPWAFSDIGKTASTFSFILLSYSRSFLVDIHTYNNTILFCCIFFTEWGRKHQRLCHTDCTCFWTSIYSPPFPRRCPSCERKHTSYDDYKSHQ